MTIRQIHDFGPAVGEYVPGIATDIRETWDEARKRLADEEAARFVWIPRCVEVANG
jgi:hypothetical protein